MFPIFGSYPCSTTPPAALAINSMDTGHNSSTSPGTSTFTNTAGTFMVLPIIATCDGGTPSISAVTYGGVAMTLVPSSTITYDTVNITMLSLYYLVNPPKGSNTISITAAGTGSYLDIIWGAISFVGQNATTPLGTPATATSTANVSPATVTLSSTTNGDYVLGFAATGTGFTGVGGGFTEVWLDNVSSSTSGDNGVLAYIQATGSSVSPSFTLTADYWGIIAIQVQH